MTALCSKQYPAGHGPRSSSRNLLLRIPRCGSTSPWPRFSERKVRCWSPAVVKRRGALCCRCWIASRYAVKRAAHVPLRSPSRLRRRSTFPCPGPRPESRPAPTN